LLETNQKFVEAYMVGLNHEISRELLWNEYPTDQRGTYARQFWNSTARVPKADENSETSNDIDQIHAWPTDSNLGEHSSRPPEPDDESQLVLLIRSELLRRYPNALVYAANARLSTDGDELEIDDTVPEKHPIFTGQLSPDVAFYGFELIRDGTSLSKSNLRNHVLDLIWRRRPPLIFRISGSSSPGSISILPLITSISIRIFQTRGT
jgi:hypothetical protein